MTSDYYSDAIAWSPGQSDAIGQSLYQFYTYTDREASPMVWIRVSRN